MVLERLIEFIRENGYTVKGVEDKAGLNQSTLSKAFYNSGTIGTDKLEKILMAYPELSAEWLLRGEGSMLKEDAGKGETEWKLTQLCKLILEIEKQKEEVMGCLQLLMKEIDAQ